MTIHRYAMKWNRHPDYNFALDRYNKYVSFELQVMLARYPDRHKDKHVRKLIKNECKKWGIDETEWYDAVVAALSEHLF